MTDNYNYLNGDLSLISLDNSSTVPVFKNENEKIKIPYISILSDRIVLYKLNETAICKKSKNVLSLANLKKKGCSGKLSRQQCSIIRKKIDTWLSSIIYYNESTTKRKEVRDYVPIFITLTLSSKQRNTDIYIKKNMLQQFLDKLKNNHNSQHIFWRAESQKNGNIHFHIISDKFVKKEIIQKYWNDIQEKEGYLIEFELKYKHKNPPSTHVKGMESTSNFIDYVLKYVVKPDENRAISGRLYGMTDSIRNLKSYVCEADTEAKNDIELIVNNSKVKEYNEDFATVLVLINKKVKDFGKTMLIEGYKAYLIKVYHHLYIIKEENDVTESIDEIDLLCDESIEGVRQMSLFDECPDYCKICNKSMFDSIYW
jgi:hypothetical protein